MFGVTKAHFGSNKDHSFAIRQLQILSWTSRAPVEHFLNHTLQSHTHGRHWGSSTNMKLFVDVNAIVKAVPSISLIASMKQTDWRLKQRSCILSMLGAGGLEYCKRCLWWKVCSITIGIFAQMMKGIFLLLQLAAAQALGIKHGVKNVYCWS